MGARGEDEDGQRPPCLVQRRRDDAQVQPRGMHREVEDQAGTTDDSREHRPTRGIPAGLGRVEADAPQAFPGAAQQVGHQQDGHQGEGELNELVEQVQPWSIRSERADERGALRRQGPVTGEGGEQVEQRADG